MIEKRVRMGLVGGGFGASFQWHLEPDCQVTAVCDPSEEALERLSSQHPGAESYRSYDELLRHPDLDAVGIFTPAPLHARMAVQALNAGKHVISAVPAGLNVEELESLLECVERTGLNYMMAETSFFHAEIIFAREMRERGEFGTIFYSEAEYHHEGLIDLTRDSRGNLTWRYGFPPMLYPTHCTGMIIPVIGERFVETQAIGWGDEHESLRDNAYGNPFWNTTGFFKTSGGHAARISIFWHVAAGGTERALYYGDRASYIMARPEGSPDTLVKIAREGRTLTDANSYPEGDVCSEPHTPPDYFDRLPEPMRVKTGHGNSHTFITHEFIRSILENRRPAVDIYEAIAYTLPGIIAHQSALRGGESLRIKDYGSSNPDRPS